MRLALLLFLPLCACVTTEPLVAGYNGDSVAIQRPSFDTAAVTPEDTALAQSTCAIKGRSAQYASTCMVAQYQMEHLFLCV